MKKCIIFSYGPVPTPEQDMVEGGGLRCWGLAKGLKSQDTDVDVTVAYHESYKKDTFTDLHDDVHITTWNITSIEHLIRGYDSVIVSYCMGDLSVEVAKKVAANQQLILDCYVPIYIEISARQSQDLEGEYAAFGNEVYRWSEVLKRGDLFLCANSNQKRYYQGVLSALGRLNPATYEDDFILIVPYGIYRELPVASRKPIDALMGKKDAKYKKLLWFGGIYPWFDIKMLIDAVKQINRTVPVKLVIVGAKNPFNAHPDFVRSYEDLIAYIQSSEDNKSNVILQDWVEFDDRANWYLNSDLVILINKIGEENELAWRTRLVDYLWADLPIITNAGDPLGEELLTNEAAVKLNDLSVAGLAKDISSLLEKPNELSQIKNNIKKVREKYYWDIVTKPLLAHIESHTRPTDIREFGLLETIHLDNKNNSLRSRILRKARKMPAYYKKYGARNTFYSLRTMVLKRTDRLLPAQPKRVVFVAHQLDTTGAPHVFIDMIASFIKAHPTIGKEFHTFNPVDSANIITLNKLGIKPKIHVSRDIELPYTKGDVIVLNTVAFSDIMKHSIFRSLENNIATKLIWYIHEDEPELIFTKGETARIKKLLQQDKIEIFTAAVKTRDNYVRHFGVSKNIKIQIYRIKMDKKYHKIRSSEDFTDLRFILPGMMADCRKGQLPIAYAFMEFKRRFYDIDPIKYRDFTLEYIGVGKDFPSRQLLKHSGKGLGKHFKHYGPMSHEKCLEYVQDANITICYSLRECLPMYVYEGMVAGHPLLRNDSSGMEEQFEEGVNGFYLDSTNVEQVINEIEKVCNKDKTSNAKLAKMSRASHDLTLELEDVEYEALVDAVAGAYEKA